MTNEPAFPTPLLKLAPREDWEYSANMGGWVRRDDHVDYVLTGSTTHGLHLESDARSVSITLRGFDLTRLVSKLLELTS